jgi:hypothetical protein
MKWYFTFIIAVVFFLFLYLLLGALLFRLYARKRRDGLPYFRYQKLQDFLGLKEDNFSFLNRDKEIIRGSIYYYGDYEKIDKLILFVHGNTQGQIQLIHLFNAFC